MWLLVLQNPQNLFAGRIRILSDLGQSGRLVSIPEESSCLRTIRLSMAGNEGGHGHAFVRDEKR